MSLIRPETGVQPRPTEKIRIIISPHQKIGIEAPVTDDAHQAVVERRAAPHRGDHAERQADDHGEQHGAEREFEGRRKQRQELRPAPARG